MKPSIVVIVHNIRSTHNVGSIFRSCDGFGVQHVFLSGYTPYPTLLNDERLPHLRDKISRQIHKTALGAEEVIPYSYHPQPPLDELRLDGYRIVALEQASNSLPLERYHAPEKVALVLGEEVHGIASDLLEKCDDVVEIPMHGSKESFNVSVACGIALFALNHPRV